MTLRKPPFNVDKFLTTIDGGRTITSYHKNQIVFAQGDNADAVFYVQEGQVKLSAHSEHGKDAVVGIYNHGDFFGEGALNGHPMRLATAAALVDSMIMEIAKAAMVKVLREQPKFAERFMAHLLARNARVEGDLVDQLFNSSEKRLARTLLLMASFGKDHTSADEVITKVSQETLAEIVGTTRGRVNTFMNKFRKLGFVEYNEHMKVHPSLLNVVLHD
jgi:CRP/FNR family transcriptional regulator, cyclic AMP receptor protein